MHAQVEQQPHGWHHPLGNLQTLPHVHVQDYFESDDNEGDAAEGPAVPEAHHEDLGNRHSRSRSRSPDTEQGRTDPLGREQARAGGGVGGSGGEGGRGEPSGSPRASSPAPAPAAHSNSGGPGEAWLGLVEYEDDEEEGGEHGEGGAHAQEGGQGEERAAVARTWHV